MARPVSPAYLLLWHTQFENLTPDDQVRFIESIAQAELDPLEHVEGKSALDRFLEAIPNRDTVFAHDMVRLLYWKGVRSVTPPSQVSDPRLSTTSSLLRELGSDTPDPNRLSSYRMAAALLETVYRVRSATSVLKDVENTFSSYPAVDTIEGLPPEVWLATRGLPQKQFELQEVKGWVSRGSYSERIQMGGPVVRGLSRLLENRKEVSPEQRMAMDVAVLAWPGPTDTKVGLGILERWGKKSQSELLDLVSRASRLMGTPGQNDIARTGALLLMAAKELGGASKELGKEAEPVISSLGSCLLWHGLRLRREEGSALMERVFLLDVIEKTQYGGNGIVRSLASLLGGAEEALSLFIPFSDDSYPDAQQFALYSWVNGTVRSLYPQGDRFLRVVDSLGEPLEQALGKHPHLRDNILPKIAAARESQLSRQLPEASMVPRVRRQRV